MRFLFEKFFYYNYATFESILTRSNNIKNNVIDANQTILLNHERCTVETSSFDQTILIID